MAARGQAPLQARDLTVDALIDARNVLRSQWPNIPEDDLVRRTAAWAAAEGVRAVIVFDGEAPGGLVGERQESEHCLVGTGRKSADDWIARAAAARARDGTPYVLVTSDRELRARAGAAAERVIGGGTFARRLPG